MAPYDFEAYTTEEIRERIPEEDLEEYAHRVDEHTPRVDAEDVEETFGPDSWVDKIRKIVTGPPSTSTDEIKNATVAAAQNARQDDDADDDAWAKNLLKRTMPGIEPDTEIHYSASSYKDIFVDQTDDEEPNHVFYVPKHGGSFDERMERVLTWKRNAEKLEENGLETAADSYEVVITQYRGEPYPVMVGEYNGEMQSLTSVSDDRKDDLREEIEYTQETIKGMMANGDYVAALEEQGDRAEENLAYEEGKGIVVVDLGEMADYAFGAWNDMNDYDSKEEYLKETGIRDQVEAFQASTGIETEDEYQH